MLNLFEEHIDVLIGYGVTVEIIIAEVGVSKEEHIKIGDESFCEQLLSAISKSEEKEDSNEN